MNENTIFKLKSNRGITLVALVITIVILIILATISINALFGNNGLINRAQMAKEEQSHANVKEAFTIKQGDYTIDKAKGNSKGFIEYIKSEDGKSVLRENGEIDVIKLTGIKQSLGNGTNKSDVYMVESTDGKTYYLRYYDKEGNSRDLLEFQSDGTSTENKDKIINMINSNMAVTEDGKVIYIDNSNFTEAKLSELKIEEYETISEKGIRQYAKNCFVDNEGKVYTWGSNSNGQVGDGSNEDRNTPICISDLDNSLKGKTITNIYSGGIALDNEGKVHAWGENDNGQVGDGSNENRNTPICISDLENSLNGKIVTNIWDDGSTIIALDNEGKVYTWGDNSFGQVGDGSNEDRNTPICISDLDNSLKGKTITNIYSNSYAVVALDDEGKVYTWGDNSFGQVGDGSNEDRNTPICISDLDNSLKGKTITNIYLDAYTKIALDNEGKVHAWGDNSNGQVGDGSNENRNTPICISDLDNSLKGRTITNIYLDGYAKIALDNEGKVHAWGSNPFGQVGDGSNEDRNTPICISDLDNSLKGRTITNIYSDGYTMIALDNEGKVYTWGSNSNGQVGDGSSEDRNTPICVSDLDNSLKGKTITNIYPDDTTIAIDNEGKVHAWGDNGYGQVGDGSSEKRNTPICISDLENSPLKDRNIVKYCILNMGLSNLNAGYCYISQDGKVYYFYFNEPI